MATDMTVVLSRSESHGFGFSVLGGKGSELPAVIYDIVENTPAGICKKLEPGDIIVSIDGKDVTNCTTKEVLRCLRLATDDVALTLKRDPHVRAKVERYLSSSHSMESLKDAISKDDLRGVREIRASHRLSADDSASPTFIKKTDSDNARLPSVIKSISMDRCQNGDESGLGDDSVCSDVSAKNGERQSSRKEKSDLSKPPRYETYLMTGEVILNVSKPAPCPDNITPNAKQKKVGLGSLPSSPTDVPDPRKKDIPRTPITPDDSSDSQAFVYPNLRNSRSEDTLPHDRRSSGDDESSIQTLLESRNSSDPANERIVWTYNAPVAGDSAKTSFDQSSIPESISPISEYESRSLRNLEWERPLLKNSDSQQSDISDSSDKVNLVSNSSECSPAKKQSFFGKFFRMNGSPKARSVSSNSVDSVSELSEAAQGVQSYNELAPATEELTDDDRSSNCATVGTETKKAGSPTLSEEESDLESLSFHYSPKAVDVAAAGRLAKRLHMLDGFQKSDIARHLSKNNEFSRAVAEEYLKHFSFEGEALDGALRKFLQAFQLTGESAERDRVLVHFSKRFLDCNPGSFHSQDSVHILTCALMLLNADLHGRAGGGSAKRMTCTQFIKRLSGLNDGDNFPAEVLRLLYCSIKSQPLEWASDEGYEEGSLAGGKETQGKLLAISANPYLDVPNPGMGTEFKRGYIMRKSCLDPGGKRTPLGKRGWKMYFAVIRDLVLYMYKDEGGCKKQVPPPRNETSNGGTARVEQPLPLESAQGMLRIHHALARPATDYKKKEYVIRLVCSDQSQFLIQAGDMKEMQSWMDALNFSAAQLSTQPLSAPIGSQQRFQRPLMPASLTKLSLREQLRWYDERLGVIEGELEEMSSKPLEKSNKALHTAHLKEKEAFLQYEVDRYKVYIEILSEKILLTVDPVGLPPEPVQLLEVEEPVEPLPITATKDGARGAKSAGSVDDRQEFDDRNFPPARR